MTVLFIYIQVNVLKVLLKNYKSQNKIVLIIKNIVTAIFEIWSL